MGMEYSVYILFSDLTGRYYTGQTQDLPKRLNEHNSGKTPSIRKGIPWRLVWSSNASTRSEALGLESSIKKRGAKRFLEDQGVLLN
jgi:putative endonuclease